ncbi:MAG: HAD family hydrolase [Deltaproteobacteria bacterium]|nr:HAD family hydrolase [Deltaproteobacteria bacterium]
MSGDVAVFLDRDGTISEEVGYVNHLDRLWLLPGVAEAIQLLNDQRIRTVVATNQSGVARGYFPETLVRQVHERLEQLLKEQGARLDGIYYCPHHPRDGHPPYRQECACRKPKPGMLEQAARDLGLDLEWCYTVGDRFADVECGKRVGGTGILVLTGYGKGEWLYGAGQASTRPDFVATDLLEAANWICRDLRRRGWRG